MLEVIAVAGLLAVVGALPQGFNERFIDESGGKCGYDSCPVSVPGKINVHIVPHTHDDVGWLKTVDQYYFGSRSNIQVAGVQYIIDSVVNELHSDPNKKFIYVETAFFWKWWKEQQDHMRHRVQKLVRNGQLEFIGGAWSMNDEATTHYHSVIDQFTWGFRKLNDTFGSCGRPKIGWQIDPFGHARESAAMMAQFGFDGLFFGRLDYQDKDHRLETQTMEMIWEGNPSLGPKGDIFTGALYNLYQAPRGFCFDIMCGDEPIIDDIQSPDYNVGRRVNKFLDYIHWQSVRYRTNEIMLTMGGDFNYQDAHYYFKNLQKLIRHVNELQKNGSNVNVFYSTPSCYVKSLNDANMTWPTKQDDFFPYASDPHAYWTGYYTSRPTLKYFERLGNNHLQICKQLGSLALLEHEHTRHLDALREAMGVMQHHDAITGTEKQHVAFDYARILDEALKKCLDVSYEGLNKLMPKDNAVPPLTFKSCLLSNISECSVSANSEKFIATVYNPLSRAVDYIVRLPVYGREYSVKNPEGKEVLNQIVPIPQSVLHVPGRTTGVTLELVFKAAAVPPLGYRSYYISALKSDADPAEEIIDDLNEVVVGYGDTQLAIDPSTGFLSTANFGGKNITFLQTLEYYKAHTGDNSKFEERASGAYIFRPKGNKSFSIADKLNYTLYKGPIVNEIHQSYSDWASQVIRQYAGDSHIEIEWLVGSIPINDREGKEVISRMVTNLNSRGTFYTDSNGRQTLERRRNFRPTWDLVLKEPIAGNYYPITTDISINDGETELTVITDRAQGGSSIRDGEIELMLHRRLLYDDAFGVGEALNEEAYGQGLIARGRHWVAVGNLSDPNWAQKKRLLQQEKVLSPQVLLTDASNIDFRKFAESYKLTYSGLTQALPAEVQILTLEPWKGKTYLLRLEHLLDKTESNKTVTVNLSNLFSAFDITGVRETSLGADRWLNEVSRLKWRKETNEILDLEEHPSSTDDSSPEVVLKPKQIKTFVCEIKPKSKLNENREE